MGFDNGHDVTKIADFKVLCAAHPDCVGFAHDEQNHLFFAKTKWSGFDSKTAEYHKKDGWSWTYIASRGDDPAVTTEKKTDHRQTPVKPSSLKSLAVAEASPSPVAVRGAARGLNVP